MEDFAKFRAELARVAAIPGQSSIEEVDRYGNTALLKSCYLGKREHANLLLRHGANIRAINSLGQNALTLATYSGNLELVRLLLTYRTYSDFNQSSIVPALCVACLRQDRRLIDFFQRFKCPKEELHTSHGVTPQRIYETEVNQPIYRNALPPSVPSSSKAVCAMKFF